MYIQKLKWDYSFTICYNLIEYKSLHVRHETKKKNYIKKCKCCIREVSKRSENESKTDQFDYIKIRYHYILKGTIN